MGNCLVIFMPGYKNINLGQEKSEVEQKESEVKTGEQKTQEHDRGEAR